MMSKTLLKRHEWTSKVTHWRESGKTMKKWCEENNVGYKQFLYWRHCIEPTNGVTSQSKNSHLGTEENFIELSARPSEHTGITLECSDVRIYLSTNFDLLTLKQCLNLLRGDLC